MKLPEIQNLSNLMGDHFNGDCNECPQTIFVKFENMYHSHLGSNFFKKCRFMAHSGQFQFLKNSFECAFIYMSASVTESVTRFPSVLHLAPSIQRVFQMSDKPSTSTLLNPTHVKSKYLKKERTSKNK